MARPVNQAEGHAKTSRDSNRYSLPEWRKRQMIKDGWITTSCCWIWNGVVGHRYRRWPHRSGKYRELKQRMAACRRRFWKKQITEMVDDT